VRVLNSPAAVSPLFICKQLPLNALSVWEGACEERISPKTCHCNQSGISVKEDVLKLFNLHIKRLYIGLSLCICVVCSHAQQTARVVKSDTLKNVTVTSSYKERDINSTAPEYTLSKDNFERLGVTDISDALHRLPGITLRDYGGAGGMKTVSVRGFGAQHTSVVYDGVALSDCQSGQIDVSRYSLDNVNSLSLIVGDNDDIFIPAKNAASAASLHISTLKTPTDDTSAHLTTLLRLGSWGYTNPFVRFDKNLSEKISIGVMGEYIYAENDYPFTLYNLSYSTKERRNNSMMNSGHVETNLTWMPNTFNRLSLKLYYYDNDRQLPGMVHYYTNDNKETQHDQNFFAQFNYRTYNKKNLSFSAVSKFNYAMTDYKDGNYTGGIKDHQYWQREFYSSACLLYTPFERWAFDYSADYAFNNFTGSDQATYSDPYRHTVLQSIAAKYHTDRFTAMARGIYSLYYNGATAGSSAEDIRHFSPSISLNYQLLEDEKLFLRASYKDIFRAPSFNESYYFHYGSTDLKPEKTDQLNLGITWSHDYADNSNMSFTLDGYYNHVKDKIVAVPYNMFIWRTINVGKVQTLGIDATANISHSLSSEHKLLLAGNYTFQKVQNKTNPSSEYYGYQIAYTPEHTGSLTLSWENPWVNLSFKGMRVSSRWANNEHYQTTMIDGYTECGVTAYRDFHYKNNNFHLRFDIKNLFNEQYEIVRFYPMPSRSWTLTMKYSF